MAARRPAKPARAAKPAKAAKPKKVKEPRVAKPGPPVESVLALVTGIMLLAAFVMVDYAKGSNYGTGLFFAGSYDASK